jgi:hypothetical protein
MQRYSQAKVAPGALKPPLAWSAFFTGAAWKNHCFISSNCAPRRSMVALIVYQVPKRDFQEDRGMQAVGFGFFAGFGSEVAGSKVVQRKEA